MAQIHKLSDVTISRIAAGEVVERPASVIKELVENALDAEATEITIKIEAAGKNLIQVSDNGSGMSPEDLVLAVERHATSKLQGNDLLNISFFGFRGEALPAIGSISRMSIKSSVSDNGEGHAIQVIGGKKGQVEPVAQNRGTTIEVRDLFYATPARLKFLRTDKTELSNIIEVVEKLAIANPLVGFKLYSEDKVVLQFDQDSTIATRIAKVVGKEFMDNAIQIDAEGGGMKLYGYISKAGHVKASSMDQYIYVNKRPVRDKLLLASIRLAYRDLIPSDKHPIVVLFLRIVSELVDVNVHPAKTEVRFRDVALVRDLFVVELRSALQSRVPRPTETAYPSHTQNYKPQGISPLAQTAMEQLHSPRSLANTPLSTRPNQQIAPELGFSKNSIEYPVFDDKKAAKASSELQEPIRSNRLLAEPAYGSEMQGAYGAQARSVSNIHEEPSTGATQQIAPEVGLCKKSKVSLGHAIGQLHSRYILSQDDDDLVVTDLNSARNLLKQPLLTYSGLSIPKMNEFLREIESSLSNERVYKRLKASDIQNLFRELADV